MDDWTDLELVLQSIGQAVIMTDLTGTVRVWNAAAERLYGWTAAEAIGRDIVDLTPSEASREQAQELMEKLTDGASWTGEFPVRDRDGRRFPALVTNAPLRDAEGRFVGIVGVSMDITELEEARFAAQRRAVQQATLARLAAEALSGLEVEPLLAVAVDAVASHLEASHVQLLELRPDEAALVLRAGVGWADEQLGVLTVANRDDTLAGQTLRRQRAFVTDLYDEDVPGSAHLHAEQIRSSISTVVRGRTRPFGVLSAHALHPGAFSDDDLDFLDAVASVLGGAIARAGVEADLRAAVDDLARSDEIRLAFLRATSHELRTPLAALVGFAETLRYREARLSSEERAQLLDRLVVNAHRLRGLIEDLLDVDRLSAGLVTAILAPHRLDELVLRVVEDRRSDRAVLATDVVPLTANIDAAKLERVVDNLVANALRHVAPGGTVLVRLRPRGDGVLLQVEDDGPGIEASYLERIFEPFVQGPERRDDASPGTGLGLTLVRELVELHGGSVTATNRAEGGARFEVTLPDVVLDASPGTR